MGLPNSEHIAKIIVDPANSDVVYACVPGRLWSDSADRGLYKTSDGGKTWSQILKGPNLSTGCASIAQDPRNPMKLFATLWDFRRKGWTFRSGGENANAPSGSGIFVTEDGGATLDAAQGRRRQWPARRPVGPRGGGDRSLRLRTSSTPSSRGRAAPSSAPMTAARTWKERDRSQAMVWRPFYFASLTIDPKDPNRLFKPDLQLIVSDDGGKSFTAAGGNVTNGGGGTHGDHHAEWIDPTNTKHVITGDDGGLWISWDGGSRWIKNENLPISQFYHVSVDDKDPYQVYGGLQDNSAWVGDSAYPGGISNGRWENLTGGDGFWSWPDPADPEHYAYVETQGGSITRVNRQTLEFARHPAEVGHQGEAALQLEHAAGGQPQRSRHDLHRRAIPVPQPRPWPELGADLPRSDHQRQAEATARGERRHHGRQLGRRNAHDDLFDQRIARVAPG